VIGKLDRLARNVHLITGLMEAKVDLLRPAGRNPSHDPHPRRGCRARTRDDCGAHPCRPSGGQGTRRQAWRASWLPAINAERQASAVERAQAIAPVLHSLAGMSARAAAAELNARKVETPSRAAEKCGHSGAQWRRFDQEPKRRLLG
jgi:hypothetical protein